MAASVRTQLALVVSPSYAWFASRSWRELGGLVISKVKIRDSVKMHPPPAEAVNGWYTLTG